MNGATIPTLVAIIIQLGLGLVVFQANPRRKVNQCFLLLSLAIGAWLGALCLVLLAGSAQSARLAIREASAAGAVILTIFNLLRLSIKNPSRKWKQLLAESWPWLFATLAICLFCQTGFFLQGVRLSHPQGKVIADYGNASVLYAIYFVLAGLILLVNYGRDFKGARAGQRNELAIILVGVGVTIGITLLSFVLGFAIDRPSLLWLAPLRVVLFSLIISYGIATRKIMEVGTLLRRIISYTLLVAYLLALYAVVWWVVSTALNSIPNHRSIAHVAAAIVIAIAMAPARGVSQRLAERLFIRSHQLDFRATVSKAAQILSSVTTLRDLLDRFANTVAEAVGADRVFILLPQKQGFSQAYPAVDPGSRYRMELTRDQATIEQLTSSREPIVLDELHRVRPTPQLRRVMRQLDSLQIALAMGIYARDQLAGVMLLGARRSGRIYGTVEQNALQVLCGQLAVAIENAELFTEVQNAKIYNETLLEKLTSGVIAVGTDERITVFNNEAGQITGLNSQEMLDCMIADLPEPLREPLLKTLATGESEVNHELILRSGDEGLVIRASTSIFHGEDRQVMGALMVLTDITSIKRLELQIRRSDRLASLGTLSAGMAHEIKNPLVSIKTFTQLLPERYQDSDFRETFSNLIGHEIERIDSLVNQLLRFARPAKPHLKPMHVHEVLEKSLRLVSHRLQQKQVKLTRLFDAHIDTIRADSDQLEQVFLNFFINAMDAMKNGGELSVRTDIRMEEQWISDTARSNGEAVEVLRITIRDTGEGIRREDIAHVFDPFFTTKDYGTGLGLSVVHGIVQEHGGQIEVESEPQKGTAFHILLPLVRFDREVAAA
jgi:two-component system nitrogen regulation sensor histidine kinase GlnL